MYNNLNFWFVNFYFQLHVPYKDLYPSSTYTLQQLAYTSHVHELRINLLVFPTVLIPSVHKPPSCLLELTQYLNPRYLNFCQYIGNHIIFFGLTYSSNY